MEAQFQISLTLQGGQGTNSFDQRCHRFVPKHPLYRLAIGGSTLLQDPHPIDMASPGLELQRICLRGLRFLQLLLARNEDNKKNIFSINFLKIPICHDQQASH